MTQLLYPFYAKSRRLSQKFGEHPSWYKKFGMKGHNGLDYPISFIDIIAADDGEVLFVRTDPDGFGLHIKIKHSHGFTLYAHLSASDVIPGDKVRRGDIIGISGNSGNSTGPHLHFGYKPNDADMNNGYYGYVDPEPFMVEDYSMSIFGVYLLDGVDLYEAAERVRQLQPRAVVVNFAGNNQWAALRTMKNNSPNTHIVGRMYKPDGEYESNIANDPEGYADEIYQELIKQPWLPYVDSVILHNEILHDGHWFSKEIRVPRIELKARFDVAMMRHFRGLMNADMIPIRYHALVSARGTPDIDEKLERWKTPYHEWELYLNAFKMAIDENHFIDLHQYGYPDDVMRGSQWYVMRFEKKVLPWLKNEHPEIYESMIGRRAIFISEGVWDDGHKSGWLAPNGPSDSEAALNDLFKLAKELKPYYDDGILFAHVLFGYGSVGGWSRFDVLRAKQSSKSLFDLMVDNKNFNLGGPSLIGPPIPVPDPEPDPDPQPPTPKPEVNSMTLRRIQKELADAGITYTPLHLRDDFDPSKMKPDTKVRVLVDVFSTKDGLWTVDGEKYSLPAWAENRYYIPTYQTCHNDDQGGATHLFFMLMTELPKNNDKLLCDEIHHGESGFSLTTDSGLTVFEKAKPKSGWGNMFMNADSAFYPGDGQKGTWTLTPFGYSDVVHGLGLINRWHISIYCTFALMTWEEYTNTVLVPEFETLREKVIYWGDRLQALSLSPYTALVKKMMLPLRECDNLTKPLYSAVSPEYKVAWKGVNYVCEKADQITGFNTHSTPRYYYAPLNDVNNVDYFEGEIQ